MTWGNRFAFAAATLVPAAIAADQYDVARSRKSKICFEEKKERARKLIHRAMVVQGIPGLSIGVTVNGKKVWTEGFGYANVENEAKCTEPEFGQELELGEILMANEMFHRDTVMRIASISKPFTSTIAARLVQTGKIDLDKDIRNYLPDFPQKQFNNQNVTITTRQLLSHTSGIRHYTKKSELPNEISKSSSAPNLQNTSENKKNEQKPAPPPSLESPSNSAKTKEFLYNKQYKTVTEALEMFKDDELLEEPGKKFSYTTHGLTLASAVLEKASGKEFKELARDLFLDLGLRNTQLDTNSRIVNHRANYYFRGSDHVLQNCPEVDCSYKWAGGGMISNVSDLLTFANAILYSTQSSSSSSLLTKNTISEFLKPQIPADYVANAALGWFTVEGKNISSIDTKRSPNSHFYHTGSAVGASSVLLIHPAPKVKDESRPSGVCVAILCNLQGTSVYKLAIAIEEIFSE